ncbi:MAG: hypothetical protein J6Q84_01650 [Kiritimatiellae bacterium]|nr:hypothetical protein [Kiritimatiellia bacterium]
MLFKRTQCSWKGGVFDRELMGRADLAKYPEAATTLENFIVRRTGAISKRRGSDELVNLKNLLGYQVSDDQFIHNSINKARLIPLVYEKKKGYFILLTGMRAFLIGSEGIKLSDGTWTRDIAPYQYLEGEAVAVEDGEGEVRPFYCQIPYADDDLSEIDFAQSGDTVFLVHKNYPPASIVFEGEEVKYNILQFNNKTWFPPRILSIKQSGTWGTSSSTKTVSYVATYVKDGIESEPSAEFQYSYQLPWGNTCRLELEVDNGNNAEDPDYFNIYKKESTSFGIIATTGTKSPVLAYPSSSTLTRYRGNNTSGTMATSDISSVLNRSEYSGETFDGLIYPSDATGALWGSAVTLNFGSNYGKVITDISLLLDFAITLQMNQVRPPPNLTFRHIIGIGVTSQRLKITMGYGEVGSATTKTVSKSVDSPAPTSVNLTGHFGDTGYSLNPGLNEIGIGNQIAAVEYSAKLVRRVSATFKDLLTNAGYSDAANTSSSTKKKIETRYIKIEAFTDSTEKTTGYLCFQGVSFESSWGIKKVFQDDYISPDMTITPPSVATHFDKAGDYPGCVAVNQQRLCFASSRNEPFTMWMSCVGDLYNFDVHDSIREDDALSFTLSATEFPEINHILECKNIMLFCDSGEWEVAPVSGNAISYKTVTAKMQSSLGCAKELKPVRVADEIIFADRGGRTLRATRYSFATDGYETSDLSVLSRDLTRGNPIRQFAYQQEPDSLVWCVLEDGTLAVLVYMKEHEMVAWSKQVLGGGYLARGIANSKAIIDGADEVALLVERDGDWRIWRLKSDAGKRDSKGLVSMDGMRYYDTCVDRDDNPEGAIGVYLGLDLEAVGYQFLSKMVTVRPEGDPKETIQAEIQNATELEVRVIEGSSFKMNQFGVDEKYDRSFEFEPMSTDEGTVELYEGDIRKTLYGANKRDGRIILTHLKPWPLTILSLTTTYQIELANKTSEGAQ